MYVREIMTPRPVTIFAGQSMAEAVEKMRVNHCKHLPVISDDGHVIGILSDRDCRTALASPYTLHEDYDPDELARALAVRKAMSPAPITTQPETLVSHAAQLMLDHQISSLPVLIGETLVGILTTTDIMRAFIIQSQRDDVRTAARTG